MSTIKGDRRQYKREWARAKRAKKKIGLLKEQEAICPSLFDESILSTVDNLSMSTQHRLSTTRNQLNVDSSNRSGLRSVDKIDSPSFVDTSTKSRQSTVSVTAVDNVVDNFIGQIYQLAIDRLFPSSKRKIDFWVIGELVALITLSVIIVSTTTQAVAAIDQHLWPLVALLEIVGIFFSLTLAKCSGVNFAVRTFVILICVGLTNFLIAKATLSAGDLALDKEKAKVTQVALLEAEIQRERSAINDLEARSRITVAGERIKRLDRLIQQLESLQQSSILAVDQTMIWLVVVIRVVLGFSVILINHQISSIIVGRKFLRLVVQQ